MTREEIIAMALSFGITISKDSYGRYADFPGGGNSIDVLERFANMAYTAGRSYERKAMPHPPIVLEITDASSIVGMAIRTEREECAKIAERETGFYAGKHAASAIRKRTKC